MLNSLLLKKRLNELTEEASCSEDSDAIAKKAIALAKDAITALENSERDLKISTGC